MTVFLAVCLGETAFGQTGMILSAQPQESPARIALSWDRLPTGSGNQADFTFVNFTILRREYGDITFEELAEIPDSAARSYTDATVETGRHYEYRIMVFGEGVISGYTAQGYYGHGQISSGIRVPLEDNMGTILLLVDEEITAPNEAKLDLYARNLIAAGWKVTRTDIPRTSAVSPAVADPRPAKQAIVDAAAAHPDLKAVTLIGRITVPFSGSQQPDGHGFRALPTDAYYADLDEEWTDTVNYPSNNQPGDFRWDRQSIAGRELMVGRIDMRGLSKLREPELELLNRYFHKNHAYRHGGIAAQAQKKSFHTRNRDNMDTVTVNTLSTLVGPGNSSSRGQNAWESITANEAFLWASATGAGSPENTGGILTDSLIHNEYKVVFATAGASYMMEYQSSNHVLRTMLAMPTYGLNAVTSHSYYGEMRFTQFAMGLPIGAMNLSKPDQHRREVSPFGVGRTDPFYTGLTSNLLGDPTLTLFVVSPPGVLSVSSSAAGAGLTWGASTHPGLVGYHIYRSAGWEDPFVRLTETPVAETSFTDTSERDTDVLYMVRAVSLETRGTGTYYNASQGRFAPLRLDGSTNTPPVAAAQTVDTVQDAPVSISLTGTDADGDTLQAIITRSPGKGRLTGIDGAMTYLPDTNVNGPDSFEFIVNDGYTDSEPVTVTLNVTPINIPPVVGNLNRTVYDYAGVPNGIRVTGTDVEGSPLTYHIVTPPQNGTVTVSGNIIYYTPAAGFTGTDSFQYVANDGQDNSEPATITLTVTDDLRLETNLRAWWRFDGEADALSAVDSAGSGSFPAALQGGAALSPTVGLFDGALSITGAGQRASVSGAIHSSLVQTGAASLWFQANDKDNNARNQVLMEMGGSESNNRGWTIYLRNGVLNFHVRSSGNVNDTVMTTDISNHQWHHLVLTYSMPSDYTRRPERISAYLDGQLVGMLSASQFYRLNPDYGLGNVSGASPFHGDSTFRSTDAWFNGLLDDVRYYSVDLTAPQVRALYDLGIPPPEVTSHGVPVTWLRETFGESADYEALAGEDSDDDGQANWVEYMAGTDPNDAEDSFRMVQPQADAGGGFTFRWNGSDRHGTHAPFQVWGSETLAPDSWVPLSPLLLRNSAGVNEWTHENPSISPYFYQIRIVED